MEKRVSFKSAWLPWVLLAPQMVVILVFFFWPAGQALVQSLQQQDAFGTSVRVGRAGELRATCSNDPSYLESFQTTAMFSVAGGRLRPRRCRCCWRCSPTASCAARWLYKTLLIWPYAVAPAVAGVLWLFMFSPCIGVVGVLRCSEIGFDWNHLLNGNHAMALIVMAAIWKQISYNFLFFLAGLQSHPAVADRGRRHRRRRALAALLDHRSSRCCRPPPSSCW